MPLSKEYPPEDVIADPSGDYAFLTDETGTTLAMAVGTIAFEEAEPPPPDVPATGAIAGTPGVFTPAGCIKPASPAEMTGIVAQPTTAWTYGQYMQTETADVAGQVWWDGAAWAAGVAPTP